MCVIPTESRLAANPTVMVIQHLGKNSIQTNRDKLDVLRHIIKNVSERLVQLIESPAPVTGDVVKKAAADAVTGAVAKKAAADAVSAATVNPDKPNVLQAMMKLHQAKAREKGGEEGKG